jgi:hypothetical protein
MLFEPLTKDDYKSLKAEKDSSKSLVEKDPAPQIP